MNRWKIFIATCCLLTCTVLLLGQSGDGSSDMVVLGNGNIIADNSLQPSLHNNTDLGSVQFGSDVTVAYTIRNRGTTPLLLLGTPLVQIAGLYASDFTVLLQPPATIDPYTSKNFTVRFRPSQGYLKTATILIPNNKTIKDPYNFAIQGNVLCDPPTIDSISPDEGPIAGNTDITITGTNFIRPLTVTIDGSSVQNIAVPNSTTITCTTLSCEAGIKEVMVTTPGGTETSTFAYWNPPTITSITPNKGPTGGGTEVTIRGANFTVARNRSVTVTIGGNPLAFLNIVDNTTITGQTPAGSQFPPARNVVVTTPGGTAILADGFGYDGVSPTFSGVTSAIQISPDTIELAWTSATDNLTPQEQIVYLVYCAESSPVSTDAPRFTTGPGVTSFTAYGLQANTHYFFLVRARDEYANVDSNSEERDAWTSVASGGNWVASGSLNTARTQHTVTLLPNGKLLIVGGWNTTSLNSAELYDPATGQFTNTGNLNTARRYHTANLLPNGKVLIIGGEITSRAYLNSAELYDPATGQFANTGNLNTARCLHTVTLLSNGKLLIAGGENDTILNSAELYDPDTEQFINTGNLNMARRRHTATLLASNKVILVGGENTSNLDSAEIYDPTTGLFIDTDTLNVARCGHTATLLPNEKVLIAGGNTNRAELYDPTTGLFTNTNNLNVARGSHTSNLLPNGKVIIVGGYNGIVLNSAELYDPATELFTNVNDLNVARESHTSTLLPNGEVLAIGGFDSSLLNSAELYGPSNGNFKASCNLTGIRRVSTATLLPNGKVLVAGGHSNHMTAELYDPIEKTTVATPNMVNGGYWHSATLLANGKVLIVGGEVAPGSAQLYDPVANTFTSTAPNNPQLARCYHMAVLLANGKVLFIHGNVNPQSPELYDPETGIFSLTAGSLNYARGNATATLLLNGKVLIVGGGTSAQTAELYDPATETFTLTLDTPKAQRALSTAILLPTGKVLIVGGSNSPNTAEIYDPDTGTFTLTPNNPNNRVGLHSATLLPNGKILYTGGENSSTAEIYDPASGLFSLTPNMTNMRYSSPTALLPTGEVFVVGNWSGNEDTTDLYNVGLGAIDAWRPVISTIAGSSNFPVTLSFGGNITITGLRFQGISEASQGNTQNSSSNSPIVVLMGVSSVRICGDSTISRYFRLSAYNWNSSSLQVALPVATNNPSGYYQMFVIVNGIVSQGRIVKLQ